MIVTDTELAQLKALMKRWKTDPLHFIRKGLNAEPTEQQIPIIMAFAKPGARVAVKAGRGVGKTALMAWLVLWHILVNRDSKSVATAPTASQLEDVLFLEIQKWLAKANPFVKDQYLVSQLRVRVKGREETQLVTGRTARPDAPDALQGLHADNAAVFVDEVFGVHGEVLERGRGVLSSPNARALMIGNPTVTSGYGFECFHRNKAKWQTFTLSCENSPLVSKDYLDEMATAYGGVESDGYKVWVLGEFPTQASNQFISRALAEASLARKLRESDFLFAPVVLGVDVAWYGGDRTCVYLRQGLHARLLGKWFDMDTQTLGGLINQWWNEYNVDAVFIDATGGYGSGPIDYLRKLGRSPIAVNFGGKSLTNEWHLMRGYMWGQMRQWLMDGGSIDNSDLVEDLIGPNYSYRPDGKKMLERKEEMRSRGLASPDLGDALCLTFSAPVRKISGSLGGGKPQFCKCDFHPFR